jgi:hypothetical protein
VPTRKCGLHFRVRAFALDRTRVRHDATLERARLSVDCLSVTLWCAGGAAAVLAGLWGVISWSAARDARRFSRRCVEALQPALARANLVLDGHSGGGNQDFNQLWFRRADSTAPGRALFIYVNLSYRDVGDHRAAAFVGPTFRAKPEIEVAIPSEAHVDEALRILAEHLAKVDPSRFYNELYP